MADKCGELTRLDPSRREFANRVRSRLNGVAQSRIPAMRFDTLKEKNPWLYEILKAKTS
jgi:hypothetical protein